MRRKKRCGIDPRSVASSVGVNWAALGGKPPPKGRKSKYNAKRTVVDNVPFPSRREAERYQQLRLMESQGVIYALLVGAMGRERCEFKFDLNGVRLCSYVADFIYRRVCDGVQVVEDCKGFRNRMYRLKKKMMRAFYGVEILET